MLNSLKHNNATPQPEIISDYVLGCTTGCDADIHCVVHCALRNILDLLMHSMRGSESMSAAFAPAEDFVRIMILFSFEGTGSARSLCQLQ